MRPVRLEIQGLTSYRERAEIDFTDLDLFAITGPTGSGKSSLVDAITYALFGEVPRVGDSVKQLITQGEDRVRVNFEFSADGGRYRVHRSTGHKGVPAVQMEHLDSTTGEWLPDSDKAREVNEHIASILGMDYDGFVRSVLLPQGQFQQFLAGKPEERRKVLDGLLRLDVYQLMGQRANQIADEHGQQAAALQQQLDTQYSDATPEALKAARNELTGLKREAGEQKAARETFDSACRLSESMNDARKRESESRRAAEDARKALDEAQKILEAGEETLKKLEAGIDDVRKAMAEVAYQPDAHLRLTQCLPLLEEIERVAEHETRLGEEIARVTASLGRQTEESRAAKSAHDDASRRTQQAEAAFDRAREGNAAALLQSKLKPGDTCPVCGGTIGHLEVHEVAQLDSLRASVDAAKAQERAADRASREIDTAITRSRQALEGLNAQLNQVQDDRRRRITELDKLLPEPGLTRADAGARVRALEESRQRIEALGREEKGLVEERERHTSAIAGAQKAATERQADARAREREADTASKQASETERELRKTATEHGWDETVEALDSGLDVTNVLRRQLSSAQEREAEINQQIGACERDIARIGDGIEKAKELRHQIQDADREARLARDLAHLLRVTAFPSYIREQALRLLALDGSRQLMQISRNRYEFSVDKQEFLVVDHWNVDDTRSVKTLSGGETFLASLALALALAEHLPGFGAGAGAHSLESLFIDEGFSNLDTETLDIVANALEEIGQGGSRMVGVVTHLPALAERMPTRITIHKSQAGSTVTVE